MSLLAAQRVMLLSMSAGCASSLASLIPVASAMVGAMVGAIGTLLVQQRVVRLTDERARHRERQIDEARYRRATLLERAEDQRRALVEVRRLSASRAHTLRNEAEYGALRVLVSRAFGHPRFADQVCDALDESAEAVEGAPSTDAGLSFVACSEVMEQVIQRTDAQATANLPPFEDPMPLFDDALARQRKVFGDLWSNRDPP
jgi:hypothetical protein